MSILKAAEDSKKAAHEFADAVNDYCDVIKKHLEPTYPKWFIVVISGLGVILGLTIVKMGIFLIKEF